MPKKIEQENNLPNIRNDLTITFCFNFSLLLSWGWGWGWRDGVIFYN